MKEQEARRDKEGHYVERVRTRGYDAYDPLQRRTGMKEIEAKDQSQRQWIREREGGREGFPPLNSTARILIMSVKTAA